MTDKEREKERYIRENRGPISPGSGPSSIGPQIGMGYRETGGVTRIGKAIASRILRMSRRGNLPFLLVFVT